MVTVRSRVNISTSHGDCFFVTYNCLDALNEHFAIIFKSADKQNCPLVRVHSECITGDLFGSCMCDCGDQLKESIDSFSKTGGIILYLRQEGRGIGLYNKLDSYLLQQKGYDTYQANCLLNFPEDMRDFGIAAKMLNALSIYQIDLLSNNPDKHIQIEKSGVAVRKKISTGYYLKEKNGAYLKAKIIKTSHDFTQNIAKSLAR